RPDTSSLDQRASVVSVEQQLFALGTPARAEVNRRFFKTGPGQYGEGDKFLGLTVPAIRRVAAEHRDLPIAEIDSLLRSEWHEVRLCALIILTHRYARGNMTERERIYRLYLKRTKWINSWDLVDASAEHIVGPHLFERDRAPL